MDTFVNSYEEGVPPCKDDSTCEMINTFLEQDELVIIRQEIKEKILECEKDAEEIQQSLISKFRAIARLQNNLNETNKFRNIEELQKSLINTLF